MLRTILIWMGGFALLGGTMVDSFAAIGRHVGLPVHGSIELMQAMVLVIGATSIAMATLDGNHARVRLAVDRMAGMWRPFADRFSDFTTACFFFVLLVGSGWIALDLWDGHEVSEVLGIPWRVLRIIANAALAVCLAVSLLRAVAKDAR